MEIEFIIIGLFWILLSIMIYFLPLEKKRKYFTMHGENRDYSEGHFNALSYIYISIGILFIFLGFLP